MRKPDRERSELIEAGKPHCTECGRLIVVGSAIDDRWLCEYCLIIASFPGVDKGKAPQRYDLGGTRGSTGGRVLLEQFG